MMERSHGFHAALFDLFHDFAEQVAARAQLARAIIHYVAVPHGIAIVVDGADAGVARAGTLHQIRPGGRIEVFGLELLCQVDVADAFLHLAYVLLELALLVSHPRAVDGLVGAGGIVGPVFIHVPTADDGIESPVGIDPELGILRPLRHPVLAQRVPVRLIFFGKPHACHGQRTGDQRTSNHRRFLV